MVRERMLPRQVLPRRFYLITRRCAQRQFLLRPDAATNNAFLYCLIHAALRCEIDLVLEPVAFLRRLVGIIPPPRRHLVRYAGVLRPGQQTTREAPCPGARHRRSYAPHDLPGYPAPRPAVCPPATMGRPVAPGVRPGRSGLPVRWPPQCRGVRRRCHARAQPARRARTSRRPGGLRTCARPNPDRACLARSRVTPGDCHAASADHVRRQAPVCPWSVQP